MAIRIATKPETETETTTTEPGVAVKAAPWLPAARLTPARATAGCRYIVATDGSIAMFAPPMSDGDWRDRRK